VLRKGEEERGGWLEMMVRRETEELEIALEKLEMSLSMDRNG